MNFEGGCYCGKIRYVAEGEPRLKAQCHCRGVDRVLHSGLIPANAITLAHFSVSAAMSLPKSAGELGCGSLPNAAYRDLKSASARAALISVLSLSTIPAGVPLGAPIPP